MKMENAIQETARYIQQQFEHDASGHDWWHIYRVWQLSKMISEYEGGDLFIIEMAALLHDLDDWKLSAENGTKASDWMNKIGIDYDTSDQIQTIIGEVSFKGAGVEADPNSLEAKIIQDADRLDAMGAIGIARTFAFGGHKNRLIYDPTIKPEVHRSFSDYKKSAAPTINHFYEKLLLLKDRINTDTGRKLALQRHQFMEQYLEHFFSEWNQEIKL
ncbi:HD domain-containing protein [uncultured Sunxiuqinia sp.]|uniref:HD domain-containing protein n=1 Tax=uncultured Sunxiuqinia sp. TaxID=1573825 RepID=UPI002AA69F11|nr:HD domain-containing protein [uncultured Sunxiuqinia sp.]